MGFGSISYMANCPKSPQLSNFTEFSCMPNSVLYHCLIRCVPLPNSVVYVYYACRVVIAGQKHPVRDVIVHSWYCYIISISCMANHIQYTGRLDEQAI